MGLLAVLVGTLSKHGRGWMRIRGLWRRGGAAPNQSSVSRAARLLFTAPTCGVCVYDPVYACAC
eukprot:COSAG06_NODE_29151_length_561_cov_6.909091_1_plen_63_part_10